MYPQLMVCLFRVNSPSSSPEDLDTSGHSLDSKLRNMVIMREAQTELGRLLRG